MSVLLLEDGDTLLLETGDALELDEATHVLAPPPRILLVAAEDRTMTVRSTTT